MIRRFAGLFLLPWLLQPAAELRVLILDGRHNHAWQQTSPELRRALHASGRFQVDVATAPPREDEMNRFRPAFDSYAAVVLNYTDYGNGGAWPVETRQSLVRYVRRGGGLVVVHAASSAFPQWPEFNEITGLGGWGGRNELSGPYLVFRDGAVVRESAPGPAGHHGQQHPYQITLRDRNHPITAGLPPVWMHASDELFDHLRGPARQLTVLATAYSSPESGGSGQDEPALFTVAYGRGRVFHTILGHSPEAMRCVGFITTLQRGAEWAATGRVTLPVPLDFPTAQEVRIRP